MDYSKTDLTRTRYFEPIKLSHVTSADDVNALSYVQKNLSALEDILNPREAYHIPPRIDRLRRFFDAMNTGNRLENAIAWEEGNISRSIRHADERLNKLAAKKQKAIPQLQELCNIWNEGKRQIPSWQNLLLTNHQKVIEAFEYDAQHEASEEKRAYAANEVRKGRKRLELLQSSLRSDFQHIWYDAAQDQPKRGLGFTKLFSFQARITGQASPDIAPK